VTIIPSIFAFAPTSRPVVKVAFSSLRPWRSWDKVEHRRAVLTISGALKRFLSPFSMWTGRGTSGQSRPPASTDHPIPSSSCGSTLSPFEQLEVMGTSWRTGSRWLQRTSLGGGSGVCRRDPPRPGGISASASSTSTLPWGQSQRASRHSLPSIASSQGTRGKAGGLGALPPRPQLRRKDSRPHEE
jgi:hypothetical protein